MIQMKDLRFKERIKNKEREKHIGKTKHCLYKTILNLFIALKYTTKIEEIKLNGINVLKSLHNPKRK